MAVPIGLSDPLTVARNGSLHSQLTHPIIAPLVAVFATATINLARDKLLAPNSLRLRELVMATYNGTTDNDNSTGSFDDDEMYGFAGDDSLNGGFGSDLLDGGDGNDYRHGVSTRGYRLATP